MKAFSHRFISLVPRCYILPHELYPLMKTKYVVLTQISILIQWHPLLQLSHPSLLYCWTCYCPQYNSNTAPWTFNNHSSYIFPSWLIVIHLGCFLRILWFPPPIKLIATIIIEILSKVALDTRDLLYGAFACMPLKKKKNQFFSLKLTK
jgi:hypothetical protein